MKSDDRENWTREDHELEAEFASVSSSWRRRKSSVPPVPGSTDRLIRRQARFAVKATDEIEQHWLLGQGPRLILVTLILFALLMYFIGA